ncbi:DUF4190 domain-containing protein [Streptomyces sp. NPDC054863]
MTNAQNTLLTTQAAPAQGYGPRPARAGNGLAGTAMVLGVIGLCTSIFFVGGLVGVVGLVLGLFALASAGRTGTGTGRGKALTAVVTSALAIVVSVLVTIAWVWYANQTQECYRINGVQQYVQCVQQQLAKA